MARRVNTGFVFVLFTLIILLTAGVTALYLFYVRPNVTEIIAQADTLAAKGDWSQASKLYARAVAKRPTDTTLLMTYLDCLDKIEVTNVAAARDYFRQMVDFCRSANNADPSNEVPLARLFALYQTAGEDLSNPDAWNSMYETAQNTLSRVPGNELAIRYRGIAQVNRMRRIELSPDDVTQAGADLEASLARNPDNRTIINALCAWKLSRATTLDRPGGDPSRAEQLRKEARELTAKGIQDHPEDMQRQLDHLIVLRMLRDYDAIKENTNRLEKELTAKPNPDYALALSEAMLELERAGDRGISNPNSSVLKRVEQLLRANLASNPDDVRLKIVLARLVARTDSKESLEFLKQASEAKLKSTTLTYLRDANITTSASLLYADQLVAQAELASRAPNRAELRKLAGERVDKLAAEVGDTVAPVNLLRGRLLLLDGKTLEAQKRLNEASTQFQENSPEALFFAAKADAMLNQTGNAASRLNRLIEIRPGFLPAYYELSRIHLSMKNNDEARRIINRLLLENPEDTDALRLRALLLSQVGQKEQAVEAFDRLNVRRDNPEIAVAQARLLNELNRSPEAVKLLEEQMAMSPTDVMVLQELVRLTPDTAKKAQYIAAARKAGASGAEIDIIESQSVTKGDTSAIVEKMINEEQDPLRRAMSRYNFLVQTDRIQEARAELNTAAKINPDDAQVVDTLFQIALQENDLVAADGLASRAARQNLDQAKGLFYQGRVELARGRAEQAAAIFRRGTAERPIFSEGWRLLGDSLSMAGDVGGAITAYDTAIAQFPGNAEAYRGLAAALDSQNEHTKALTNLRRAVELNPQNPSISALYLQYEEMYGDKQRVLETRIKIAKDDPSNFLNRRLLAVVLAKLDRFDEAAALVDQLLKDNPDDMGTMAVAATVRKLQGKPAEGRKLLQDYVNAKGDKARVEDWILLARYLRDDKDWDASMAAYRQAITIEDTRFKPATREMTDMLFDLQQFPPAIEGYSRLYKANPNDFNIAQRLAESYIRNNQPELATDILAKLSSSGKPDAGTVLLEAVVARMQGNTAKALDKLAQAESIDPSRPQLFVERATLLSSDPDQDAEVIKNLSKALELKPGFAPARIALASVYARRGENNDAIRELNVLLDRDARNAQARLQLVDIYARTRQFTQARKLLDEAVTLFPGDASWLRAQASVALLEKKPDLAQQKLREAFALSKSPQILADLTYSYIDTGKFRDAIKILESEPDALSKIPQLQALLGRARWALNQNAEAKAAFTNSIEISRSPADVTACVQQMTLAQGAQASIELLEPLATGIRRDVLEYTIANLWSELKAYDKSMQYLRKLNDRMTKDDPLRPAMEARYAQSLQLNGNNEEARNMYQRVIDRDPNELTALNNLAYMLAEDLNNPKEALPLAQRAVKLRPEDPMILDTLGWVQFRAGQRDEAYDTLRKSVDRKTFAGNTYHLAEVLIARGDIPTGRSLLDSAKRLAEQNKETDWLAKINKRLTELGP